MDHELQSLLPGTTYLLRLSRCNSVGWSPWTPFIVATTSSDRPSRPDPPVVVSTSPGKVRLKWLEPENNGSSINKYRIVARLAEGTVVRKHTVQKKVRTPQRRRVMVKEVKKEVEEVEEVEMVEVVEEEEMEEVETLLTAAETNATKYSFESLLTEDESSGSSASLVASAGGAPDKMKLAKNALNYSCNSEDMENHDEVSEEDAKDDQETNDDQTDTTFDDGSTLNGSSAPSTRSTETSSTFEHDDDDDDDGNEKGSKRGSAKATAAAAAATAAAATTLQEEIVVVESWEDIEVESIDQDLMKILSKGFKAYEGESLDCEIHDLGPGMTFQVFLTCDNEIGTSDPSDIVEFQVEGCQPTTPLAPELNVEMMEDASSSSSSSSGASSGAFIRCVPMLMTNGSNIDAWRIECQQMAAWQENGTAAAAAARNNHGKWRVVSNGPNTSVHLSNDKFDGGDTYNFRVHAHNRHGWSPPSNPATYLMLPAPSTPPQRLKRTERSSSTSNKSGIVSEDGRKDGRKDGSGHSSLSIEWEIPASNHGSPIVEHRVECVSLKSTNKHLQAPIVLLPALQLCCSVQGLEAGTMYAMRVASRNKCGWSKWSDSIELRTESIPPSPPFTTPRMLSIGCKSMAVEWDAAENNGGDTILGYTVELREEKSSGHQHGGSGHARGSVVRRHESSGNRHRSHKFKNLSEETLYAARVRSINSVGTSAWTEWTETTATSKKQGSAAPPTPYNLETEALDTKSFQVTWRTKRASPPIGVQYHVCLDCDDGVGFRKVPTTPMLVAPAARDGKGKQEEEQKMMAIVSNITCNNTTGVVRCRVQSSNAFNRRSPFSPTAHVQLFSLRARQRRKNSGDSSAGGGGGGGEEERETKRSSSSVGAARSVEEETVKADKKAAITALRNAKFWRDMKRKGKKAYPWVLMLLFSIILIWMLVAKPSNIHGEDELVQSSSLP